MLNIIKIANKNASIPELPSSLTSTLFGPTRSKQVLATRLCGWIKSKAYFCTLPGSTTIRILHGGSCTVEKFMMQVALVQIFTYGTLIWEISLLVSEKFNISLQSISLSELLTNSFQYALSSEKVFSSSNKVCLWKHSVKEQTRSLQIKIPVKNFKILLKLFFLKQWIYTDRGIVFQTPKIF